MGPRKPFLLRIDPVLWAELEAWAQAELRSVNGQIEYLLKQALQKRKSAKRFCCGLTRPFGLSWKPGLTRSYAAPMRRSNTC